MNFERIQLDETRWANIGTKDGKFFYHLYEAEYPDRPAFAPGVLLDTREEAITAAQNGVTLLDAIDGWLLFQSEA